jgi:hypothetical protein
MGDAEIEWKATAYGNKKVENFFRIKCPWCGFFNEVRR